MTDGSGAPVYLSVAANLDPEENIVAAVLQLRDNVRLEALSSFYWTAPIGRPEQSDYLNGVARIRTTLAPLALKIEVLRPIEAALGRVRTEDSHAARPIDLDILLFGDQVIHSEALTIPDPDITARPFLSAGLLELAPDLVLPGETRPLAARADTRKMAELIKDSAFSRRIKELVTP